MWLTDTEGWVEIDKGSEYPKYPHAQKNYFPKPLFTDDGIARYKLVDGKAVERSTAELETELDSRPAPEPTMNERINALEEALDMILLGVTE